MHRLTILRLADVAYIKEYNLQLQLSRQTESMVVGAMKSQICDLDPYNAISMRLVWTSYLNVPVAEGR
jgi:hypothetical protein